MLVQVSPQGFPQMAATARAELGHRQEQGTPSGSATCVAGAQRLELSSTAFPGTLAGSWIRNSSWNLTGILVLFFVFMVHSLMPSITEGDPDGTRIKSRCPTWLATSL